MSLLRQLSDANIQDGESAGSYHTTTPLTIDTSGQYSPAAILASALINGLQYEASMLAIPISELHHLGERKERQKENYDQNEHITIPKPEQFRQLEVKLDLTPMLDEDWTMGEDDELYSLPDISPQWFSPDENEAGINWDEYIENDIGNSYGSDISESENHIGHFEGEADRNEKIGVQFHRVPPIITNTNCYLKNNSIQISNAAAALEIETLKGNITPGDNVILKDNVTPTENVTLKGNITSSENVTLKVNLMPSENVK